MDLDHDIKGILRLYPNGDKKDSEGLISLRISLYLLRFKHLLRDEKVKCTFFIPDVNNRTSL